jgi:DNA-binding transcriptional ArsR family regulator
MAKSNLLIPNSTQIPNVILDKIIPGISEADARCLLYICRRTYGFQKQRDRISLTQFVVGIVSREGEVLDYGTGMSRPAVVEALKNLSGAGLIKVIKEKSGNSFELNCELFMDKYVEKGVVNEINRLRKLTRTGKLSKPKQVKLLYPQNKGNKEKQSVIIKSLKNDGERPVVEKRVIPIGDPPINKEGLKKINELKEKTLTGSAISEKL